MNNQGFSLVELVVAAAVIGIIMMGVVSSDYAIRQAEQTSYRRSRLALHLSGAMAHIMKNASLATGRNNDEGVFINNAGAGFPTQFCFRQDIDMNGVELDTPDDLADDTWACYEKQDGDIELVFCREASAGPCGALPAGWPFTWNLLSNVFNNPPNPNNPDWVLDDTTNEMYFEITLITRFDPALPEDRLDNPEISLTSRVSPVQHSF